MVNKIIVFSLMLLLASCSSKVNLISGEYVTYERTKMRDLYNYLMGRKLLYGVSLKLNTDHTYTYANCTQVNIGRWYVINDTLKLKCEKLSFLSGTVNNDPKYKNGTICSSVPRSLFVDGNSLIEKVMFKNMGEYTIILHEK